MKNLYVHQHTRLGDMILCNALIRIISNKNKDKIINIFCRSKHRKLIKFMYRDHKKIKLISIDEHKGLIDEKLLMKYEAKFIQNFILKKKINDDQIITIGFDNYEKIKNLNPYKKYPWPCEIVFYKQLKIPFKKRFSECYWKRDLKEEKKLYNKLIKKDEKYIFIHDDPNRNMYLKNFGKNLKIKKIIKNDIKNNIFNYSYLIERADEIHIMESSIRQIIEVLKIKTKKIFLYKGRGGEHDSVLYNPIIKRFIGTSKKWNIVKNGIISRKVKNGTFNKLKLKLNKSRQKIIYLKEINKLKDN